MTVDELNVEVPATADLTEERAWAEYLHTCQLHRNSHTYEAAEAVAWTELLQKLALITRTLSDERRKATVY